MLIDFNNNTFNFLLKEKNQSIKNSLSSSNLEVCDNKITLNYNLDNEEKKIIIHLL